MSIWDGILAEAKADRSLYLLALFALTQLLVRLLARAEPVRLKALTFCLSMHLAILPIAGVLRALSSELHKPFRFASLVFAAISVVGVAGAILFTVILPRVGVRTPRILQDVLVAGASVLALFLAGRIAGYDLSGLVATSAVLTAIIGFSLQDSLANVTGGMALQLDNSIEVGDWIKVNDVTGKVTEIRWRYTAVETRNWETVLIPNSVLMKNQVIVLGRRTGVPVQWRRWVYFNIDFRHQPSDVIEVVTKALAGSSIDGVSVQPPPNCVLMDLHESYARYAVRYWLTDLAADDPTDSAVRTVIYFALRRAGIPLSIPAHALFVTEESTDRKAKKSREDLAHRIEVLGQVELFSPLSPEDRAELARSLRYAPFTSGEVITRQGAEAHWLYLIVDGEVSVRVASENGLEREVAQLAAPSFFGEMSLMTGEPRSATVVALTDVECFRLDKAAFQEIVRRKPQIANHVASVLAKRRIELLAAKEGLDQEASNRRLAADQKDLLGKIRRFFGLDDPEDERAAG